MCLRKYSQAMHREQRPVLNKLVEDAIINVHKAEVERVLRELQLETGRSTGYPCHEQHPWLLMVKQNPRHTTG